MERVGLFAVIIFAALRFAERVNNNSADNPFQDFNPDSLRIKYTQTARVMETDYLHLTCAAKSSAAKTRSMESELLQILSMFGVDRHDCISPALSVLCELRI